MAGQNAAYDQFPCQYQIFYRGKARQSMWYDPVFQVSVALPLCQCQTVFSVEGQVSHTCLSSSST